MSEEYFNTLHRIPAAPKIVIAVLTYRRTERLASAIDTLMTACEGHLDATVLVVDNNPAADAEATVLAVAAEAPSGRLRYVHEPRPGIAAARNRAIEESPDARLLVFVDDDERPAPGWLDHLLRLYEAHRPAAIAGPVISRFAREPEQWVVAGGFFSRRRLTTGTPIGCAATNNLLLDLAQVRAMGIRFDNEFGLSGGSDTLFTRQIVRGGGTVLWCDEAIVIDEVPDGRLTRHWVLQKAFRQGNATPRIDVALADGTAARLRAHIAGLAGGAARLAAGCAAILVGAATANLGRRARGARLATRGVGMFLGSCGYRYVEYSRDRHAAPSRARSIDAPELPVAAGGP